MTRCKCGFNGHTSWEPPI